jgi:hypothetical protein
MIDFRLIETGNGGDLVLNGNDISLIGGWQNMIYLAMFGGNVEENTGERASEQLVESYWANELLWPNESEKQFNSSTERTLQNTPLNEHGRRQIEDAVTSDLNFISDFANYRVEVEIVQQKEVRINIFVTEPDVQEEKEFQFIWNSLEQELEGLGVVTENIEYRDYQVGTQTPTQATDVNKFIFLASSDDTTGDEVIGFNTGQYDVADIETVNVDSFDLYVNGTIQTGTFELKSGDTLRIDFTRVNVNEESRINLVP